MLQQDCKKKLPRQTRLRQPPIRLAEARSRPWQRENRPERITMVSEVEPFNESKEYVSRLYSS